MCRDIYPSRRDVVDDTAEAEGGDSNSREQMKMGLRR